jgi:hypothetical protein
VTLKKMLTIPATWIKLNAGFELSAMTHSQLSSDHLICQHGLESYGPSLWETGAAGGLMYHVEGYLTIQTQKSSQG